MSVSAWLLRLALSLAALCFTLVALIRALAVDDLAARAFLEPAEACAAPCFAGITPGLTTLSEAATILNQRGWRFSDSRLNWQSEGLQPVPFEAQGEPFFSGGLLIVTGGLVSQVTLDTHLSAGSFLLAWGSPDVVYATTVQGAGGPLYLTTQFAYLEHRAIVSGTFPCPFYWTGFRSPVGLSFQAQLRLTAIPLENYHNFAAFMRQVTRYTQTICRK